MDPKIVLILIGAPIVFVAHWSFVCWVISKVGGWAKLARRFPADFIPNGGVLKGESLQLNRFCNYNMVVRMTVHERGLHLAMFPLFVFHKPILIPWNQILHPTPTKLLWIEQVRFQVGDPAIATIRVSRKAFARFPGPGV